MMFIDKMVSDVLMKYDTNLHCNVCKTDASYKELLQSEYVYPCKNFKNKMYEDRSTENSPLSKIRTKYSLAKI
jgi:hypothetical protein